MKKMIFVILAMMSLGSVVAFAKLPASSAKSTMKMLDETEARWAITNFAGNGKVLASSNEDQKTKSELAAIIAKYPSLLPMQKALDSGQPTRVQIEVADGGDVIWKVWVRGATQDLYSIKTSPGMANYYKDSLLSRPDAGKFGYDIIPAGGTR